MQEEMGRDRMCASASTLDELELSTANAARSQELLTRMLLEDGEFSHETGEFKPAEKGKKGFGVRIGEEPDEEL
jgi:hypothetical protein